MTTKANEIQIGDGSLHIGDRVVYPNQGICRITGVEVKQIAGHAAEFVTLSREEDPSGARVMVPLAKVMGIGLRKVATKEIIDEVFDYLASPTDDPQLDWKVRHRENADKMTGGGLFGTAEVLKGLHALTRVRPLPQKERELYDSARHLLVSEIAAACGIPLHAAEDNLDYALFPPPGMKRKGMELKLLVPAVAVPMKPLRAGGDDDDLGFDDDAEEEAIEAPEKEEAPEADESGEDEGAQPAAIGKAAKAKTTGPAKGKPAAAGKHAPAAKAAPAKSAPTAKPAAKKSEHKPEAKHPAKAKAASAHPPARSASAKKPSAKPAAKSAAHARPAAKAPAKSAAKKSKGKS